MEANALTGTDWIVIPDSSTVAFQPGPDYGLSITGTGENAAATGDLDIIESVLITGSGADVSVIDANLIDRVLDIMARAEVEITAVYVTRGKSPSGSHGGGIRNRGILTLNDCSVIENMAGDGVIGGGRGGNGGGIFNTTSGNLTLQRCTVSGNAAGNG